ncbi:MAG: FAD-dependent oxidoreductase [Roseivirga sp.]|nr:FAD-dependent oxidoreductase [Roseivirga sp.]
MTKNKIIVVGAGAWGGWSAYMLQRAGYEVTLIDKEGPGHERAGSGGKTRIIRMAYGGSQVYTDMVDRSFRLWEHYCEAWSEDFYHEKGSLWMFRGVDPAYATLSQPLMREKGYALNKVGLDQVAKRYPQIYLKDITSAFYEPKVGYLEASRACKVVKAKFEEAGGTYVNNKVISIEGSSKVEAVICEDGMRLVADQFVFACGPWMKALFPDLNSVINITRQEVYYYQSPPGHSGDDLPIWLEFREGDHMYYGIPDHFDQGFKLAYDQRDWSLDPDKDDRGVTQVILKEMSAVVANRFPDLKGAELLKHHTCVYESSLDGHYIMDRPDKFSNAVMLCGSSGHGFKMGPAVGEMVVSRLRDQKPFPEEFRRERLNGMRQAKSPYEA